MDKIFFAINETEKKILCIHEKDYSGNGYCMAIDLEEFEKKDTQTKLNVINDTILALLKSIEIKNDYNYKDYVR